MIDQSKFECAFVPEERIDRLMSTAKYEIFDKVFGNTTVLVCQLENGFTLTEMSACINPDNYDYEIGRKYCKERLHSRLWELKGYALADRESRKPRPRNT